MGDDERDEFMMIHKDTGEPKRAGGTEVTKGR